MMYSGIILFHGALILVLVALTELLDFLSVVFSAVAMMEKPTGL